MRILITLAVWGLMLSAVTSVEAAGDEHLTSSSESKTSETQGTRVAGQITHIEGWHYTIKDSTGQEVSFGVTSETDDPDKVQEGDYIVAMIREDRIALSIKNMKKKRPQG